jgi:hypothetical protein
MFLALLRVGYDFIFGVSWLWFDRFDLRLVGRLLICPL